MTRARLHQVSPEENRIIQRAQRENNPNWFNSFYLKGEQTGTWWKPDQRSERWRRGYDTLLSVWKSQGRPEEFLYGQPGALNKYTVHFRLETGRKPIFHHHHGFLLQPWQLELARARQRISMVIGGVGCGKTLGADDLMLYWAATLPGFKGMCLAPNSTMTREMFDQSMRLIEGTEYENRFLIKAVESPLPRLTIGNSLVGGTNTITFLPIGDAKGIRKLLTLTIDAAIIDQSEQLMNLKEVIRVTGTRMRGSYRGRSALGRMIFLANSDENEELWDLHAEGWDQDLQQRRPNDRVFSASPKTWDNPFITDDQLDAIRQDVGGDEDSVRVYMEGGRPLAGGLHFSAATLNKCKSEELDALMARCIAENRSHVYERADRIGVWQWALPPMPGRKYLVVADPGSDNPPNRNSAVIMVFDYTDFGDAEHGNAAKLWGFYWVFGNHDPWNWINKYVECVRTYNAHFSNAIDASGFQSMYDRIIPELQQINVTGLKLNENTKKGYLNLAKSMAAKGMFKFPNISRLFQQLSHYRIPDDDLSQDMVACLLVAAGWLENVFYTKVGESAWNPNYNPADRNYREAALVPGQMGSRYERGARR